MNSLLTAAAIKAAPMDALQQGLRAVAALSMILESPDLAESLRDDERREGFRILFGASYHTMQAAYEVLDEEAAAAFLADMRSTRTTTPAAAPEIDMDKLRGQVEASLRAASDGLNVRDVTAQRNAAIVEARLAGEAQAAIGARFGVSARMVRHICSEAKASGRAIPRIVSSPKSKAALRDRNEAIIAERIAGARFVDIAERYNLSEPMVQRICGGVGPKKADVWAELPERNEEIWRARCAGEAYEAIAARFGITKATVEHICYRARRKAKHPISGQAPIPILTEAVPMEAGLPEGNKARA